MAKDHQVIAINDAVHKLQLAMLDGITDQKQLFAAGTLISRLDYEDVVTERTLAKLCGYPLCRTSLPSEVSRRGKYRISLKEHKVYDLQETRKFCSAGCLINSRAFSRSLQEARTSDFDTVKLNHILGLFGDSNENDSLGLNEELVLSKLTIRENVEVTGGERSLEQWMGPSNAVEGYVPCDRTNSKSRNGKHDTKATQNNQKKNKDPPFSEMDFTSTVIISDEYSLSKLPPQTKQASPTGKSEDGEGKSVLREQTGVPATKNKSRFRREKEKDRKNLGFDEIDLASFGFDGIGCASFVSTNDGYGVEYSVSKQPTCSTEVPLGGQLKEDPKTLDEKISLTGSSSASKKKGLRLPTQTKQASHAGKSKDGKGKAVMTGFEHTTVLPREKVPSFSKDHDMEKDTKNFGFDEMSFEGSAIMSDGYIVEYGVSKQPLCSVEDSPRVHLRGLHDFDGKISLLGSYAGSNCSRKKAEKVGKKGLSVEYHANSCKDGEEILTAESYKRVEYREACSSSETVAKSCLKISDSKKLNRSVTWADQNDGHGDLCEFENNDIKTGLTEDVNSVSRLALAEACATALSQAAEAVCSGDLDANDAAAKAGIVLLPSTHQLDEEISEECMEEEMNEEEPTLLKWPNKPGIPDSDLFDRDQSWFDGPPEGFNLTLSSFAIMWNALFGWVSSSSLAYIYGKDESAHEDFLSVNGKEYPRRIVIGDGLSSEIRETIAGCLARALPRVATDLRLPIAISELEKGLGSLLETMSLIGAVPSFRVEKWLVIVLLFLDALSVSHIPRIAPYLSNRNKVLEGSGIGSEEFETMKDILLPLGRVPQFATRSGG